jgi:hypothetical protein
MKRTHALRLDVEKKQGVLALLSNKTGELENMKAFAKHIFSACILEASLKEVESICRASLRKFFQMPEIEDEDDDDDSDLPERFRAFGMNGGEGNDFGADAEFGTNDDLE